MTGGTRSRRWRLGVADVDTEDLPAPFSRDPSSDHHCPGHDLAQRVVTDMHIGRVEVDVRKGGVTKGSGSRNAATRSSNAAQIRETSDFEIPVSTPRAATRLSTLRVETPLT